MTVEEKTQIVFEIKSKRRCQQIEKQKRSEAAMQKMWNVLLKLFGFHLWLETETRANMLKLETISSWADPELEIYGSLSI